MRLKASLRADSYLLHPCNCTVRPLPLLVNQISNPRRLIHGFLRRGPAIAQFMAVGQTNGFWRSSGHLQQAAQNEEEWAHPRVQAGNSSEAAWLCRSRKSAEALTARARAFAASTDATCDGRPSLRSRSGAERLVGDAMKPTHRVPALTFCDLGSRTAQSAPAFRARTGLTPPTTRVAALSLSSASSSRSRLSTFENKMFSRLAWEKVFEHCGTVLEPRVGPQPGSGRVCERCARTWRRTRHSGSLRSPAGTRDFSPRTGLVPGLRESVSHESSAIPPPLLLRLVRDLRIDSRGFCVARYIHTRARISAVSKF